MLLLSSSKITVGHAYDLDEWQAIWHDILKGAHTSKVWAAPTGEPFVSFRIAFECHFDDVERTAVFVRYNLMRNVLSYLEATEGSIYVRHWPKYEVGHGDTYGSNEPWNANRAWVTAKCRILKSAKPHSAEHFNAEHVDHLVET